MKESVLRLKEKTTTQ